MSHDELTQARWEQLWSDSAPIYDPRLEPQLRDSLDLIRRFWSNPYGRFLEAGCGPAANALNLAAAGAEVVGVDVAPTAVEQAEAAFGERGLAGSFVVGDVRALPFANDSFDFVYAGGVVEHFLETEKAVGEMVRVVRPGGGVLLTVPALTFSYPYLFMRGNVPAVPLVEPGVRYVQFRILRGGLATYGYERSFLRRQVVRTLRSAGLVDIAVGRFDTHLPLLPIPRRARRVARLLARTDAFAPMYFGTGTRPRG